MPTSDCEDQTSLAFYEEIEKVIMKLGGRKDSDNSDGRF